MKTTEIILQSKGYQLPWSDLNVSSGGCKLNTGINGIDPYSLGCPSSIARGVGGCDGAVSVAPMAVDPAKISQPDMVFHPPPARRGLSLVSLADRS